MSMLLAENQGKVERPFYYIEEQFVKGNHFKSMEELNSKGKAFVNEWCNEVHTTTGRIPNEFYEKEEKKALQQLPRERLDIQKQLVKRIVSNDSFISISTNKYSLPVKYAGKRYIQTCIWFPHRSLYDEYGTYYYV